MKRLLFLFLILPALAQAQNTPVAGAANQTPQFLGGILIDKALLLPRDTIGANALFAAKPSMRRDGAIVADSGVIYLHDGTRWLNITPLASVTGVSTQSGTGARVIFPIAHGLNATPSYINVSANTSDAGGYRYIGADETNLYVYYSVAPAAGTNNLKWSWIARP